MTTSDGGAPAPDALVIATDARGQVVGRVPAERDGTFRLAGLPSGPTTVAASATEHEPSAVTVAVEPGATSVADLVLAPTSGLLSGVVTGPDGAGPAGATVTALDAQGEVVDAVVTDGAGSYALLGVLAGEYTVVASTFAPVTTAVQVPAGGGRAPGPAAGTPAEPRAVAERRARLSVRDRRGRCRALCPGGGRSP